MFTRRINYYISPEIYRMINEYYDDLNIEDEINGDYILTIEDLITLRIVSSENKDVRVASLDKIINIIKGKSDFYVFLEKKE